MWLYLCLGQWKCQVKQRSNKSRSRYKMAGVLRSKGASGDRHVLRVVLKKKISHLEWNQFLDALDLAFQLPVLEKGNKMMLFGPLGLWQLWQGKLTAHPPSALTINAHLTRGITQCFYYPGLPCYLFPLLCLSDAPVPITWHHSSLLNYFCKSLLTP